MKTLFVAHNFPPVSGGISQIMYTMCKSLPPDKVVVLAPWGTNTSSHPMLNSQTREAAAQIDAALDFPVHRTNYSMRSKTSTVLSVIRFTFLAWRLAVRHHVDLIYFSHAYPTAVAGLLLRMLGFPFAVHTYGSELIRKRTGPARWLRQRVLKRAFRVSAISRWGKECLVSMGVPGEKVVILHPKIDTDLFARPHGHEDFKRREGLHDKLVILTVGHLVHRKGQHLVLQALPDVVDAFPQALYVAAGAGPDRDKLENMAKELGVDDHVIFPGNRDLVAFYHACDVFILPSLFVGPPVGDVESFGVVYIEAGACGKPVIGADNGGIPDAVSDGESGLLVETGNVQSIANAIKNLLGDRELRDRLGRQGFERVQRRFRFEKYASEFKELILEPLQKTPST